MTEDEGRKWNAFSNELVGGGVSVAQCRTTDDAQFLVYLLGQRGIRSGILVPAKRMDLRLPQVRVAPQNHDLALRILAEPLPPGMREEYDSEPDLEFPQPPSCPRCRADEVVLDGIEPGNRWRCQECGEEWTEMFSDPEAQS